MESVTKHPIGGAAETYRKMMLDSEKRHESELNSMKDNVRRINEQLYAAYVRINELNQANNQLQEQLCQLSKNDLQKQKNV